MIGEALAGIQGIRLVQPALNCDTAAYFLSFTVSPGVDRNRLLAALHRRGLFLLRTWESVPAFNRTFKGGFRYGASGSVFLADHICHVPIVRFANPRRIARLARSLKELVSVPSGNWDNWDTRSKFDLEALQKHPPRHVEEVHCR